MEKKEIKKYLEWVALGLVVIIAGVLTSQIEVGEHLKPQTTTEKALGILGVIVMAFVVLGIHELGHLLMGLWQGFRFELYVVGPLGIRREADGIKVYFNTNLGYFGGVAATSPREDHPDNARRIARIVLAGPLASLLFAGLCFAVAGLAGGPFAFVLYTGGAISIAIFFATTIPSRTGMFFTDRKRYQRLVTPGKEQQAEMALLSIMGKFAKDGSYADVKRADIDLLIADEFPFYHFFGLFNLVCWQLEHQGQVAAGVMEAYLVAAEEMPKHLVQAFDQEVDKYRQKLGLVSSEA